MSMQSIEQYRYTGERKKAVSRERLDEKRLVVCVDDEPGFSEAFARCFTGLPDMACFTVRQGLTADQKLTPEQLRTFFDSFDEEQLTRIDVVVIDQFFDQERISDYRNPSYSFIQRLRSVNKTAWILETSGNHHGPIYPETNAVQYIEVALEAAQFVRDTLNTSGMRLTAFRQYSFEEFVEAQSIMMEHANDPESDAMLGTPEKQNYDRLRNHDLFEEGLNLIGASDSHVTSIFDALDAQSQQLLLHHFWHILGHLRIKSEDSAYSGSLQRALVILGLRDGEAE